MGYIFNHELWRQAVAQEKPAREDAEEPLVRGLNLTAASSIVVGIVIGSGIFIGSNRVAQGVESVWGLMAVWIAAGLLTLLGALTYAEFGAAMPRSGGDYVYTRRGLGAGWGFLTGWITFFINLPASIGALALAFASQLDSLKPALHEDLFASGFAIKFTAIGVIAILTLVNYLGVRQAGMTQTVLTGLKLLLIGVVVLVGMSQFADNPQALQGTKDAAAGGFALALVGAFWAYDGWSGVSRVAAEVKNPSKNLPKALIFGILGVIAIYVLINLAYLAVFGLQGLAGTTGNNEVDRLVASRAAEAVLGANGLRFVAIMIMVSILGPLNGLTLSGPRVYYAMARDRLFPAPLARVHPFHRTPHVAIVFQGALAAGLALFLTFEILSSYVVLAAWLQYALTAIALMRLRKREPDLKRPYKVPLYPAVPILFIVLSLAFLGWLIVSAVINRSTDPDGFLYTLLNVAIIGAAWPAWLIMRRHRSQASA
jgi:basic amino acid/polyamine antiporter, APA family